MLPYQPQQQQRPSSRPSSFAEGPATASYSTASTSAAAAQSSSYQPSLGSMSMSTAKSRQYAHLHSQLAQLNAHLADTENLMRMTATQAGDMRFLGGYVGGLFMGAAKVLGEEGVRAQEGQGQESGEGHEGKESE